MGSNQYLVSDYSEDFDIVLTDESFGLFLKREGSLVKLKKSTANEIHCTGIKPQGAEAASAFC